MDHGRGRVLYLPDIMTVTGMPEGTIRSRYHSGTMPCVWKLGRRLVAYERELDEWLEAQRRASRKDRQELEVRRPDDETLEVLIGGDVVMTANHDEHGWTGMEAVRDTARAVYERLTGVRA